jgi:16S rRNA (guanine(527)-N(7))-methyltransferase RsmG
VNKDLDTLKKDHFLVAIQSRIKQEEFFLTPSQAENASIFAEILYRENKTQNLTRIVGIEEFIDGHLIDVIQLFDFKTMGLKVLDLGSGCGIPGLLAAAIDTNPDRAWFLCDSEKQKCDFLNLAAQELNLYSVKVFSGRVESLILDIKPDTVISRAVGSVEKIAGWISNCSTWNNLILFKSKGWEEEWKMAQRNKFGKKLTVTQIKEYAPKNKYRILVNLIKSKK